MPGYKKLHKHYEIVKELHERHKGELVSLIGSLGQLPPILLALKINAEKRENSPEYKLKVFNDTVLPSVPKHQVADPQELRMAETVADAIKKMHENQAFKDKIHGQIMNRK